VINFDVVIDSSAGIQLQTEDGFIGYFDASQMPELAALVFEILSGSGTGDLEGLGEECRLKYDTEDEVYGIHSWFSRAEVIEDVEGLGAKNRIDVMRWLDEQVGATDSKRGYYRFLFELRDKLRSQR